MTAGVHWWGGLKLVLAALGVIALGTAIKTFMSWSPRTSGGNALFTIGVAIVGALLFGKLLPKGGAAAVTGATSYPMAGSTIVGAVPSVTPTVQPTVQPQGITVIQQAAKPASTTSQIISGISGIASSFFGAGGGFGSLVGGSKGIQDVDYSLGSGADRYSRLLNLTAV
jgi:hypothetical protein